MVVDPRGERTDEPARQIVMWRTLVKSECRHRGTNKQRYNKVTWRCLGPRSNSAFGVWLADIEEGRLCGKRRRVAFIYELRIEPTKEGNVV